MSGVDAVGAPLLKVGLVLTATVVEVVTREAADGTMGLNGLAGIRTRATRSAPSRSTSLFCSQLA